MKITKRIILFIMLALLIVNIGCSGVPVKIDSFPKRSIDTTKGRVIRAQACGFQLLLLIPIMINGRQARAYQYLLMNAGGDYITNVKVKESWTYGLVGTIYCTELEATAYPYMVEK
mgnify:FL=1